MCADSIVWPIWLLFQKSFETGVIPEMLKTSRVVPVFMKGERNDVKNYRIVAISTTILKIFERAFKFKLISKIEPKLSNAQHGFRPKRSIVHESFMRGNQVDVFYGDFKNAFDKVWHRRLIEKISKFNVEVKTAKWLYEFVVGRRNFVKIGNAVSEHMFRYLAYRPEVHLDRFYFQSSSTIWLKQSSSQLYFYSPMMSRCV